jgi:hypothetical protein
MAKTIIALHDDAQSAYRSLRELIEDGFVRDDISVVTPLVAQTAPRELFPLGFGDYSMPQLNESRPLPLDELRTLFSDLESIKVPVVGSVYAAGPLAVELSIHSSATFGSMEGSKNGMMGALMKMGVSEERAHYYAEGVRRGGTLVMVKTPDYRARDAVEIINRHKPVDLNKRAREWRQGGWTGFKAL